MDDDILPIGMAEMNQIFDVIDKLGISREAVQVELLPAGRGTIERHGGKVRLVLPAETPFEQWLPTLQDTLSAMTDLRTETE